MMDMTKAVLMLWVFLAGAALLSVPLPAGAGNIPEPGPPACGYCGVVGCHNECQRAKVTGPDASRPAAAGTETASQPQLLYRVVGLAFTEGRATVNVRYPQFDRPWLDAQLKAAVMTQVDSFLQQAREFAVDDDRARQYTLRIDYSVQFLNGHLLSMLYTVVADYAGAHPSTTTFSLNADLSAGRLLTFADLFRPGTEYLKEIARESISILQQQLEDSDTDWLRQGAGPESANYRVFYLTPHVLVVHFNRYQVACYAAGPQEVGFAFAAEPLDRLLQPDLRVKLMSGSY